jgi:hypothetical protein
MNEAASPTLERLEDQISWYDAKSQAAQHWFKALKVVQLIGAGLIPLVAVFDVAAPGKVTAILGLIILIVDGLQQLNQYQSNWISYRSTCEALRHEKYLFLAPPDPTQSRAAAVAPGRAHRSSDFSGECSMALGTGAG